MSQQARVQPLMFSPFRVQPSTSGSPRSWPCASQGLRRFVRELGAQRRWLGVGLVLLVGGCASPVPIASLKQQSGQGLDGQLVYIEGKAVDRVPLLDGRVYRIEDGTGWIWVLSQGQGDDIALGKTIRLKAELRYQDISAGQEPGSNPSSKTELYAVERQRLP